MKKLVYQKDKFDTKDAHQVCLELEAGLGVMLHVADAKNPNNVQGYIETDSDGTVGVFLYEQEDVNKIDAMPQYRVDKHTKALVSQKAHIGIYRTCDLSESEVRKKIEEVLTPRGFSAARGSEGR